MSESAQLPVAGTVVVMRSARDGFEVLMMRRPERGSFAGAWVFPGGKVEDADRQGGGEVDDARRAGIRETQEEVGLVVRDLVALSRWQPPAEAPVRIRTWFFLARAEGDMTRLSEHEVAETRWISPAAALAAHATGEWTLYPPTWVTLHRLSRFPTVDEALASSGAVEEFATRVRRTDGGTVFEWDALRLETASLPWRLVEG